MHLALSIVCENEDTHKARTLGFRAVHLKFSRNRGHVRCPLGGFRCSVHAGDTFWAEEMKDKRDSMIRYFKEGVEFCKVVGSQNLSFHPPVIKDFDLSLQNNITLFRKRYSDLLKRTKIIFDDVVSRCLKYSEDKEVRLAIESFCYPPFIFEDLEDFCDFSRRHSNLGFLMDVSHLYQAGIDLARAVKLFGKDLRGVHLSDARKAKGLSGTTVKKDTHLPIEEGEIDFRNLIALLKNMEYESFLAFEIRGTPEDIARSKKKMEKILDERR